MKKNPIIIISASTVIIACLVVALVFGRGTAKLDKKGTTTTIEKTPGSNTTTTTKPNNGQMTYRIEPGLRYESQYVQSGYYLKELMSGDSKPAGLTSSQVEVDLDDGNLPTPSEEDDGILSKDEMVKFYEEEFGEKPSFINE